MPRPLCAPDDWIAERVTGHVYEKIIMISHRK